MKEKAPKHLTAATRRWWERVADEYELEEHHRRLLTLAASAYERAEEARVILDKEGLTYTDKHDQPKARPEVGIERDSRIAFARLLRELSLDVEPPPEVRPPRRPGTVE